jgi:hypothetical protein
VNARWRQTSLSSSILATILLAAWQACVLCCRVVHERVPKCHARVAHIFVDGFTMLQDDFAEQTEQFVDEVGERDGAEVLGIDVKFRICRIVF